MSSEHPNAYVTVSCGICDNDVVSVDAERWACEGCGAEYEPWTPGSDADFWEWLAVTP